MCKIFRTFAAEMKNKGYLYALYALFLARLPVPVQETAAGAYAMGNSRRRNGVC